MKLFHLQQQNQVLQADVRRQKDVVGYSYIQEKLKQQETSFRHQHITSPKQAPIAKQTSNNNRRRQFARQRAVTTKAQKSTVQEQKKPFHSNERQKMGRIAQINKRIDEMNEMKLINGKIRMERSMLYQELEQLQGK